MRKLFTLLLVLFDISLFGQSVVLKINRAADRAFNEFSYAKAAELYKRSLETGKDSLVKIQKITDCHRYLNEPDSVEKFLAMVVDEPGLDPNYLYYYAQALTSNKKYDESMIWYTRYQEVLITDNRAPLKLYALDHFEAFYADSAKYLVNRLSINSPGLDFSPAIYGEGIVFVSSRKLTQGWVQREFNWDDSRFLDLFELKNGDVKYFDDRLKTDYHEGPLCFYNGQNKMVFTRNNYQGHKIKKDEVGVTRLKLYFAEKNASGEWRESGGFAYNNDNYSCGHPALNEEGNALIFTSDMTGGFGETDLFISHLQDGAWSEPANLSDLVNTKGKEMFPTLVGNVLLFASDGHPGLGGLDIFSVTLDENYRPIGPVKNLGMPINSNRDDFGLVANDNFTKGYFTTARNDDTKDDIYEFEVNAQSRRGRVMDRNFLTPVSKADVFLLDTASQTELYVRSDDQGYFDIPSTVSNSWVVTPTRYGYAPGEAAIVPSVEDSLLTLYLDKRAVPIKYPLRVEEYLALTTDEEFRLQELLDEYGMSIKAADFKINPIYYDLDESEILDASRVELNKLLIFFKVHPDVIIELSSHTDSRADIDYNLLLSHRRANAVFEYLVAKGIPQDQLVPQGYGETRSFYECKDECTEEQHRLNRRTEFIVTGKK